MAAALICSETPLTFQCHPIVIIHSNGLDQEATGRRRSFGLVSPTKETLFMQPLRTYIVEDSQVIRENLIATLEELVPSRWWAPPKTKHARFSG
jgi:hypothetical protein